MKILFVASIYRHLTSFHLPYISYFQSKGYEVWVAASEDKEKEKLEEMGVNCIDISFSRSPFKRGNLKAYFDLKKVFQGNSFELIHVHTPMAAFLTRMAFRKSKKGKIIYTAHGFHFFTGGPLLNWLVYYSVEKIAAKWTDILITINEEDYNRAMKMGYKYGSVEYVHGVGVEPVETENNNSLPLHLKESLKLSEEAVIISYIAELNKNKNHLFLLENWNSIKKNTPNAVLMIIGDGELREYIEKLIEDMRLKDVYVLGYLENVDEVLKITNIVSLLSYREGLPKSIMEAMSHGIPCVVSNIRGLKDLIKDGENGYTVKINDNEALVSAFLSLLNNESKRLEMGKIAKKNVEPYLLKNVLNEYKTIYEKVLRKE